MSLRFPDLYERITVYDRSGLELGHIIRQRKLKPGEGFFPVNHVSGSSVHSQIDEYHALLDAETENHPSIMGRE